MRIWPGKSRWFQQLYNHWKQKKIKVVEINDFSIKTFFLCFSTFREEEYSNFFLVWVPQPQGHVRPKNGKNWRGHILRKIEKNVFFTFYIYKGAIKSLKSAILTTPKWAVVDFSDFNYTKLYVLHWKTPKSWNRYRRLPLKNKISLPSLLLILRICDMVLQFSYRAVSRIGN